MTRRPKPRPEGCALPALRSSPPLRRAPLRRPLLARKRERDKPDDECQFPHGQTLPKTPFLMPRRAAIWN